MFFGVTSLVLCRGVGANWDSVCGVFRVANYATECVDLTMAKPTGWEEPSPPSQRRNVPYDDGTSVWSSHAQPQRGMTGRLLYSSTVDTERDDRMRV